MLGKLNLCLVVNPGYYHTIITMSSRGFTWNQSIIVVGTAFAQTAYDLTVETDECTSSLVMRILQSNLLSVMLD